MFHSFYLSEQQNQGTENIIHFDIISFLNKDKMKSLFVRAFPLAMSDNRLPINALTVRIKARLITIAFWT